MDAAPIFIVGAPRSGTTLLRLVLNSHPRIGIPAETEYFPDVYERYAGEPAQWRDAVELFIERCNKRLLPPLDLGATRAALLALDEPDFGRLLSLPLAGWAAAEGKLRWGEKTPFHIFHADSIVRLFPAARVLVMLRDPRATVASMNRFGAISNRTALNARLWFDVYTKGIVAVEQFVPSEHTLTVRYESLITNPEPVIKEVCDFLDEPFDPAMLAFYESTAKYDRLRDTPKVHQPIHGDPENWRAELSDRDLAVVEAICGPLMETFGYARAGRKLRRQERAEIATSLSYLKLKHWQHRRRRYHPVVYEPFARFRRSG